jgi:hypothetical protein
VRDGLAIKKRSPRAVIIKETAHMYQASQADSCALIMCVPCLLGLGFTLPRAIADASIFLTLHTIVIAPPVGSRLREYIASRRFETHPRAGTYADSLATFSYLATNAYIRPESTT